MQVHCLLCIRIQLLCCLIFSATLLCCSTLLCSSLSYRTKYNPLVHPCPVSCRHANLLLSLSLACFFSYFLIFLLFSLILLSDSSIFIFLFFLLLALCGIISFWIYLDTFANRQLAAHSIIEHHTIPQHLCRSVSVSLPALACPCPIFFSFHLISRLISNPSARTFSTPALLVHRVSHSSPYFLPCSYQMLSAASCRPTLSCRKHMYSVVSALCQNLIFLYSLYF